MIAVDDPQKKCQLRIWIALYPSHAGPNPQTVPLMDTEAHDGTEFVVTQINRTVQPVVLIPKSDPRWTSDSEKGPAFLLDPRALVFTYPNGLDGEPHCIYTPRDFRVPDHLKEMRPWLYQHPEWGKRPVFTNMVLLAETLIKGRTR